GIGAVKIFRGLVNKLATVILPDLDGHPLAHHNKLLVTVTIEVNPLGIRDQADMLHFGCQGSCSIFKLSFAIVDQDITGRNLRIAAGDYPAAHKNIWIAVRIDVVYSHYSRAASHWRKKIRGCPKIPFAIVKIKSVLKQGVIWEEVAVAAAADIQVPMPISIGIKKCCIGIFAFFIQFKVWDACRNEGAIALLYKQLCGDSGRIAYKNILQAILIDISANHHRRRKR